MKFLPWIIPPTLCANLPNSFAPALVQHSLCLGSCNNLQYLSHLPVLWSRTGLADSLRLWATRSAMDDNSVLLWSLTLLAIDSGAIIVDCFRIGLGCGCCFRLDAVADSTTNWGAVSASNLSSWLASVLNCTLGGALICTLEGVSICTLGEQLVACPSGSLFPGWSAVVSCVIMASICVLSPRLLPPWWRLIGLGLL